MEKENKPTITVENVVNAPIDKVWEFWSKPTHITKWNNASEDWHSPHAENDLQAGGKFIYRMEAKDGSFGFDFSGVYVAVTTNEFIEYLLDDGRGVKINFTQQGNNTKINETFEAESLNSIELQKAGWQAILDNFKKYTETN